MILLLYTIFGLLWGHCFPFPQKFHLSRRDTSSFLTVGELVHFLEQFDDEMPVHMDFDNGYTYGGFDEHRFEETDIEEDEEEDF